MSSFDQGGSGSPLYQQALQSAQRVVGLPPIPGPAGFDSTSGVMAPGLAAMWGLANVGMGIHEMIEDPSVNAGLHIAQGAKTTVASAGKLAGASKGFGNTMSQVGGVLDGAQAINDVRQGNYSDATLNGTSSVLGFAAPELVVPWKVGNGIGKKIKSWTEGVAEEKGYFGEGKTMSDHANSVGRQMEAKTGSRLMGGSMAMNTKMLDTGYTSNRWLLEKIGIMDDGAREADGTQPVLDAVGQFGGNPAMLEAHLSLLGAAYPEARAALKGLDRASLFQHYAE